MELYHKIETIYNRNIDGNKKLMEGDFRSETVKFLKDVVWQFTEKIDGTNIRIMWDGHKVTYGGRTERASIPAHLMNKLIELFGSDETEQVFEQLFGEKNVILFGEGYGAKIQGVGSLYRSDVSFILFDVMVSGVYLPREAMEGIAKSLGIEVVPIIMEGTLDDGVAFVKKNPMSTIGSAPMEGLVARPKVELQSRHRERIIVKIKARDFA